MAIDTNILGTDIDVQQSASEYFARTQPSDYEKLGPNYAPVSSVSQEATVPGIAEMPNFNEQQLPEQDPFADIKAYARGGNDPSARYQPDYFNWDTLNTDKFVNSPHYKSLGFDSRIGEQLNEEKYAANQTAGDVVGRMFGGFTSGVLHGAADMASHWGTLTSAIASGDLGQLYSQEVLDEVAKKQKDFDNDWHIFKGESTGMLTSIAAGIQGTGHLVGAIGEMVAEQIVLDAAAALTLGATSEVNVAAGISESARLGAMADKLSQSLTTPGMMKKLWNGMARSTQAVGKSVPGLGNTIGGWGKLAAKGMEAEGSAMRVVGRGFGNFVRDMRSVNMATSFASGNAAGTYQQMVNDRTQRYAKEHGGMQPDDTEVENIKSEALRAAKADGAINALGMLMMESMAFGNLLAPRKLISQSMEEAGGGIWGNIGMKPVGLAGAETAPLYVKNQIKWKNLGASMFQWGKESGNYGQVGKNILKHSTSFGVTMNMMGAIDNGVKAWFDAKYDHNDISIWDGARQGAYSQFSKEGAYTFISGFLTGAFLHGVGSILAIPTKAGMDKVQGLRDKDYQTKKDAIRTQEEEFVSGANRLWADPLQVLTKEHKVYKDETDDTLHSVNDQNGFSEGMQRAAGTGAKKEFHDIEDDASREVLIKLMRNKLADSWVQRAKDYASTLDQDELTKMFNVDNTPENYKAIVSSINKLEPRLKDLKDIVRQVDSTFKNPFNPYATDPATGKRLYEDGSESFIREYTDWKTHSGMKDYVIAIKDKALRANQRQKEIFYGTSDTTGLTDMAFAEDLGMTTLMTASSLDLLQNELNILQEMATNGDKGAIDTIGPLKEYQDVLSRYTTEYKDILDKGAYPDRDIDIAKLNERYKDDLTAKLHDYIGKTLTLKNMKGKVIDSKPLPSVNDVRDAMERMLDYYQLQAEEGIVLMKLNSLLDPKVSRAFQDIYFREKAARDKKNKQEAAQEAGTWSGTGRRPTGKETTTGTNEGFDEAEVVTDDVPGESFQPDKEQAVVEYLTAIPDGERYTYDNEVINSIPGQEIREEFIDEIESIVRTADSLEDRNKKIIDAVESLYDDLHDMYKTQTEKEYPSLRVGIQYMGDTGYGIVDSTTGSKPVNNERYPTIRAANRAIDRYVDTTHPVIENSTFRVGEHISLNTGDDKGKTYRIWSTELLNNERVAVLKETVPHYDDKGKEIGTRTTGNTTRVSVGELNRNYVTGKVEPVIKKDQFNPNYPKLSIPDANTSIGAPKAGGPMSKETAEDKLNTIRVVSAIPVKDMENGTGFSISIKQNIGTPKEIPINNNPQALYKAQQFLIELRHNGQLVGYVTNPTYYVFRPNGGKGAPKNVSALTIDDVKALFKPIARLSTAEQWHKHLNSTYNQALQFLGKITDGMIANGISAVDVSDLGGIVRFKTVYSYDWIKKGEVGATLREVFDNMKMTTPEYYITRNEYVEGEGKVESDLVVNSTMESEEDENTAISTPAIGQLGMYKAVIKLPSGEFHAIHLVPKQMNEGELDTMMDKVANATDTDSAKAANKELREGLFISIPVYDEDGVKNDMQNMVITPTVFTTGKEPVVSILITQGREASGKPIQVGKGQFTVASLKGEDSKVTVDRLIEQINSVLGDNKNAHLDIPDITTDNLKVQPSKDSLLDMETSVTKNLFRDVSVSYEVIDPKGGERIIETIIQQQPKKKEVKETKQASTSTLTESQERINEIRSMYAGGRLYVNIDAPGNEIAESLRAGRTDPKDIYAIKDEVGGKLKAWFERGYQVLTGKTFNETVSTQGSEQDTREMYDTDEDSDNYQLSAEELEAAYGVDVATPDITPQDMSLEGNEYDSSIMESEEEESADIDDLSSMFDAEQEELEKQSRKGKVTKIVSSDMSEQDVEDIDTFTQVIKDTLPEGLLTIGDIDTVSENMARNGVVVGQFYTYLNEVGDVQGRIDTKDQNPGKYHESIHAVLRMLLTDEQYRETIDRAKVENPVTPTKLKAFRKEHPRYDDMTDEQLKDEYQEEFIADEYDKYASGHSKKMKLPWLQRLFNKIGYWLQYMKDLFMKNRMRAMFYEVKTGKYKNAKLQDNQFTRNAVASQPVPMIKTSLSKRTVNVTLPDGSTVERTNVFTKFLPEQEASQLLNNIRAEAFSEMEGERYPDIDKAIDTVINRYADTFNIDKESPARTHLLSIKDKAIRMETARNLKEYGNIFNNAGNKEVIKNEIRYNLHINGLKKQIDDEAYDTEASEVGDRNADTKFLDKQSGGYGSIGSNIKRDMASTFTTVAELSKGAPNKWGFTHHADGKPMVQGIDTNAAYAGMLKTLSDTFDSAAAMKKLIAYNTIGDNPNTGTYIARVLRETGFDIERFNKTGEMMAADMKGANRLNGILSTFMQQNKNYLNVIMDPDTKKVIVADSNRESVDKKQYSEWSNAFYDKYVSKTEEKGVFKQAAGKVASSLRDFNKVTANGKLAITDQKLVDIANSTSQKFYDLTGTNLHPIYWQYSILSAKDSTVELTPLQKDILDSFDGVYPIDYNKLQINFLDKLDKNNNPFSRGDNESSRSAWEKEGLLLADANARFSEDIDVTSHKNANGDTVYNYGYPSYNTVEIAKLNTYAGIEAKMADPQTKGSHLLSDPNWLAMKKTISVVGAISSQSTSKSSSSAYEGVDMPEELADNDYTALGGREKNAIDFSDFLPRDYVVFNLGKYDMSEQKGAKNTKGNFWTVPVSLGINEAKSTHILSRMPFEERVSQAPDVLWRLTDKSKEILYNSVADEVEQIKRAYLEIAEGKEARMQRDEAWKKDYHDGKLKGERLFRTREMLGEELSKDIEDNIRENRDYDVSTIKDRIESTIQDNLYTQLNEFIKILKEERLIKEDGTNSKLPEFLFNGYSDNTLNQELGMRKGSFTRNLANVYMNEYIQYMGITHLLYGDMRERVKNITDMWKRNAGLNGTYNKVIPVVGYEDYVPTGKFSHITFEDDIFTTIWGDEKERDDGQMYTDPHSYSLFLLGQGKLGDFRNDILKKMSNGTKLTKKEQKEILKSKSASNPLKLVYDDAKVYMKSSVTPLFYEDVAVRENGEWVAIKGRERAFNILQNMVNRAKTTGQPVLASPVSVNKASKENIVNINGTVEDYHWRERSGQFLGNQVDNPTGSRVGVWPVQIGYQIAADQNADGDYYMNGKKIKGAQVISKYMDALAARKDRTFLDTIASIYEPVVSKEEAADVQFNAGKFMERIHDTLLATGSDSQTMELFSVNELKEAKYNINLAPLVQKATQLYLSMFTKGGTQQKVPMVKFTMMSDSGFPIMRKALEVKDGEVTKWEVVPMREYSKVSKEFGIKDTDIQEGDYYMDDLKASVPIYGDKSNPTKITGYYSEGLRPYLFDTEIDNQQFDDAYKEMLSSRIPGTSAHSNTVIRWVDTISQMYGDTAIYSKDIMTRDGHDKDLDKGFGQFFDTYIDNEGKRKRYGSATTPEGKLEEFITYQMTQNKELQRRVRNYTKEDADIQDLYKELSKKKYEQSDLGFQIKEIKRYLFDEQGVTSFNILTGTVDDVSPEGLTIHIGQIEKIGKVDYDKMWKQSIRELKAALSENRESKKDIYDTLEEVKNIITLRVMRELKLPTTVTEFTKAGGEKLNIGTQNNIALSAQMSLLSSEHVSGGGLDAIINRPTTTDHLINPKTGMVKNLIDTLSFVEEGQEINPLTQRILDRLNDKEYDQNGMLGQLKAYDANSTGKKDVGAIANMIQIAHIANQFDIHLRPGFGIWFDGKELKSYSGNKTVTERSRFQALDTIAQMDVDAAKDHLPSRFNLSTEFTGYIGNMIALGLDETTALLYPLTKVWDDYKKEVSNSGGLFGEKKQYGETWLSNRLRDMEKSGAQLNTGITHEDIVNYLKTEQNDLSMNYTLLTHLEKTRAITENGARNISKILRLDNARNLIEFDQIDDVLNAFSVLGVGKSDVAFEVSNVPFDIRNIITRDHKNIAENYKQLQLIAGPLSKKAFLSRQNISEYAKNMVLTNFNVPERDNIFKKELMYDWNSYLSLIGLKKYLSDNGMYEVLESMNQDIMWSASDSPKNIATIVEAMRGLKGVDRNRFANSLAVVKPVPGKSNVTQANINTWVKMSEQMQRKLVDSFRELVASTDETRYKTGLAFFNYLLVSSGGQFKSGSFIRFTPEFMFKDWSDTMNKIIETTSKDFETEDERDAASLQVFNTPYLSAVENFMKAYSTNIGNKGYLKSPGYSNFANFTPDFSKDGYDLSEKEVLEYNERTTEFLMPGDSRLPFNIDIVTGKVSVNIFNGIRENEWVDAGVHGMIRTKKGKFSKVEKVLRDRNLSYLRSGGFNTTADSQIEFPFSVRIANQLYTLTRVGRSDAKSFNTLLSEGETIPKGVSAVYERSEFTGDYKQWKAANAVFGLPAERTVQPEKEEIVEEPAMTSEQPVVLLQTSEVPKVSSFTDLKKIVDKNSLNDKDREAFEDMESCFDL